MAKYVVKGEIGEDIILSGESFHGGVDTVVELDESEAEEALSAGKIELMDESTEVEDESVEEVSNVEDSVEASEDVSEDVPADISEGEEAK